MSANVIAIPADGTLLRDEIGSIFVIYGGAKFHVPDPPTLNRLFPNVPYHQLWNGAFDYIGSIPIDGTLLREESGSTIYIISGGQKTVTNASGTAKVDVLWNGALNQIPSSIKEDKIVPKKTIEISR